MMPDIDGFEVCKKIKQDAATNHVKIMILSATWTKTILK